MEGIVQNKRRLFIIGASGFGREVEQWLKLIPEEDRDWYVCGFLDVNLTTLRDFPSDLVIVGNENTFTFERNDLVVLAIAEPKVKKRIFLALKDRVEFYTYIAPNTIVGDNCNIGEGSIICPSCILTTNIHLGKCITINTATNIGHDVIVDDFTSLMANVDVAGCVKIEEGVFVGSKAMIIPSRKIYKNSIVGAGSVVIRNVKENTTVFGNPAVAIC